MGMVGTIIGLISMFAHMDDPKKIGPGVAVYCSTLYGAIARPTSSPADRRQLLDGVARGDISYTLVIDGVMMIREQRASGDPATC